MYQYYWDAEICYAYLADVVFIEGDIFLPDGPIFRSGNYSRWFTRGWTLQGRLALAVAEFFGEQWRYLGSKTGLADVIEQAT
jgi:hypothetical protein